jgi:hypothetical protein
MNGAMSDYGTDSEAEDGYGELDVCDEPAFVAARRSKDRRAAKHKVEPTLAGACECTLDSMNDSLKINVAAEENVELRSVLSGMLATHDAEVICLHKLQFPTKKSICSSGGCGSQEQCSSSNRHHRHLKETNIRQNTTIPAQKLQACLFGTEQTKNGRIVEGWLDSWIQPGVCSECGQAGVLERVDVSCPDQHFCAGCWQTFDESILIDVCVSSPGRTRPKQSRSRTQQSCRQAKQEAPDQGVDLVEHSDPLLHEIC